MIRCFLAFFLLLSFSAEAKTDAASPIDISASRSLEWNRAAKTYTAIKDVRVSQGDLTIESEKLIARYADVNAGTNITRLEASENVVVQSPPYRAYGDVATYDVAKGQARLTGKDLRIETPAEKMTAKDAFEFDRGQNTLSALGGAVVTRGTDRLAADKIDARFKQGADGKMAAEEITATGGVTITTLKETITGNAGHYDVAAQKAVLTGNVKVKQGENWLSGTRAEVDMKTGLSRLFGTGDPETEGRVRGVFYPKSQTVE